MSNQRIALITGCSEPTSIGATLALDLQRRGYRVFVSARNDATLKPLAAEGLDTLELDVTNPESIAQAKAIITEKAGGRLDVLVNNAGVAGSAPVIETDLDRLRAMFEVNVFAPVAMTQAFTPLLVDTAKKTGHKSVVVNVGSAARWGFPWLGGYGASKAAVQVLSDTMRREMKNLGVTTITIELSAVKTAMSLGGKEFPLRSAKPSGYFDNYGEMLEEYKKVQVDQLNKGPSVQTTAQKIGAAIVAASPPPVMWLGAGASLLRFIIPLLPLRLLDNTVYKLTKANLVQQP